MFEFWLIFVTVFSFSAVLFIGLILLASIYAVYDLDRELTDDLTDE